MIFEVLLPIPVNDKTFYYKELSNRKLKVGQLIEVKFRKKNQLGMILKVHSSLKFSKPLLEIEEHFNLFLTKEIIDSMQFLSDYSCNSLSMIFKQFISNFSKRKIKSVIQKSETTNNLTLSSEQNNAYKILKKANSFKVFVLNGVTGSGKTRVYINIVIEKLKEGFQCLIMVPEIILTKEWVSDLFQKHGVHAEVFHSSVKKSKKDYIWNQLIKGKSMLVIGTRSSLFLPFSNLGLIVVDEEHDNSYKQEDKLIVNARDFAIVRSKNSNSPIILCSATPSIETIHNCYIGKFEEIKITKRIKNIPLPQVSIVDMKKENRVISDNLVKEIKKNLMQNHQTMIFINKRGYTSFVLCKSCGHIKMCPNCNVSLVLHDYKNNSPSFLLCHHCSHKENFKNSCLNCNTNNSLEFPGEGIEKIFEEIKSLFPESKSIFISSDSSKKSGDLNTILNEISENKIDIFLGTQIISKGHNFPYLKTVVVLNIDNLLNDFDFRSFEKAFQQIVQVSGRAGRKNFSGNVFIQTFQSEHPVLQFCKDYKFDSFYKMELKDREKNYQPPFSSFISLIITSLNNTKAENWSKNITKHIKKNYKELIVLGPSPAVISMKNQNYRYRILIKIKKDFFLQRQFKNFLKKFRPPSGVKFYIDVDPISFL